MAVMTAIMFSALHPASATEPIAIFSVNRVATTKVNVTWPGAQGSFVLQSAAPLKSTDTSWLVVDTAIPALNAGEQIELLVATAGLPKYFRLWQP